jgi:hypothetical protein
MAWAVMATPFSPVPAGLAARPGSRTRRQRRWLPPGPPLSVRRFDGAGQGRTAGYARAAGPSAHPAPPVCRPRNRPTSRDPAAQQGFYRLSRPNRSPGRLSRDHAPFGRPSVGLGCRLAAPSDWPGPPTTRALRANEAAANTRRAATAESAFHTHDRRATVGSPQAKPTGRWPDEPHIQGRSALPARPAARPTISDGAWRGVAITWRSPARSVEVVIA